MNTNKEEKKLVSVVLDENSLDYINVIEEPFLEGEYYPPKWWNENVTIW